MPLIEVVGTYSPRHTSIVNVVADMLKYDEGEIVEVVADDPLGERPTPREFRILVDCTSYTPQRWASFGLKTKLV